MRRTHIDLTGHWAGYTAIALFVLAYMMVIMELTAGVGGSLLSVGSAAGVALMGQARGQYTFFSHLKWSWAIAIGFAASVAVHLWLNAHYFSVHPGAL